MFWEIEKLLLILRKSGVIASFKLDPESKILKMWRPYFIGWVCLFTISILLSNMLLYIKGIIENIFIFFIHLLETFSFFILLNKLITLLIYFFSIFFEVIFSFFESFHFVPYIYMFKFKLAFSFYFELTTILTDYGLTIDSASRPFFELEIVDIFVSFVENEPIYIYVQTGFPVDADFIFFYDSYMTYSNEFFVQTRTRFISLYWADYFPFRSYNELVPITFIDLYLFKFNYIKAPLDLLDMYTNKLTGLKMREDSYYFEKTIICNDSFYGFFDKYSNNISLTSGLSFSLYEWQPFYNFFIGYIQFLIYQILFMLTYFFSIITQIFKHGVTYYFYDFIKFTLFKIFNKFFVYFRFFFSVITQFTSNFVFYTYIYYMLYTLILVFFFNIFMYANVFMLEETLCFYVQLFEWHNFTFHVENFNILRKFVSSFNSFFFDTNVFFSLRLIDIFNVSFLSETYYLYKMILFMLNNIFFSENLLYFLNTNIMNKTMLLFYLDLNFISEDINVNLAKNISFIEIMNFMMEHLLMYFSCYILEYFTYTFTFHFDQFLYFNINLLNNMVPIYFGSFFEFLMCILLLYYYTKYLLQDYLNNNIFIRGGIFLLYYIFIYIIII